MNDVPVRVHAAATGNRPAGTESRRSEQPGSAREKKPAMNKKFLGVILAGIIALGLLGMGTWFVYQSSVGAQIDESKQQAVFFTNGQAYFGKLERLHGGYYKLDTIYYLQTKSDEANDSANPQDAASQSDANVELIKLGSEIHGPEDSMIFHRDQILYFENLKPDGRVSEAIANFQK